MRILLLSQWFEPEPVFKGLEFAVALRERGHEVEVLTGFPNYPGGRLYPGYELRRYACEDLKGITVHRSWLYPSHDTAAIRRVANYGTFALSAAITGARLRRPDVIYAYHPPPTIALPAFVLRARWKVPVVYDVQDLWPETVATSGMVRSRLALDVIGRTSAAVYRGADRVAVLSPGFRDAVVARGVRPERVDVIYNWAAESSLRPLSTPSEKRDPRFKNRFVVMFAGTMGLAQDLETVLAAAALCQLTRPNTLFVFVGGGVARASLEESAGARQLDNVLFLPFRPIAEMAELFSQADLLLVHLKDDPLFRITIPSKTQAYMASGKPILMAVSGDAADLVQRANAGITCCPGDPHLLAEAVGRAASLQPEALAALGRNGLTYYRKHLSLRAGAEAFERSFEAAIDAYSHSRATRVPG